MCATKWDGTFLGQLPPGWRHAVAATLTGVLCVIVAVVGHYVAPEQERYQQRLMCLLLIGFIVFAYGAQRWQDIPVNRDGRHKGS
jgi:uncharacterized membrane protein YoaT (DUF817 family)